ncbi:MAG: tRNA 2-selenouridine(34) synthase MnmH, partial [Halieaceae bacterium]|nr:tRNA 2-selenouridine(34) synthase MnmH [Halieaceae bacterium]
EGRDNAFEQFSTNLRDALARISKRLGGNRYADLRNKMTLAINEHRKGEPEQHKTWITTLLSEYYDPMYDYQLAQREQHPIFQGNEREVSEYLMAWQKALR